MSKFGIALSILFVAVVVLSLYYANICTGFLCGIVVIVPAIPWGFLFLRSSQDMSKGAVYMLLFVLYVINLIITYQFGALLERLYRKIRPR